MFNFSGAKKYCLISGSLLFLLGLLGFAFRGSFEGISDRYLIGSLILGVWGVGAGFGSKD